MTPQLSVWHLPNPKVKAHFRFDGKRYSMYHARNTKRNQVGKDF